MNFNNSKELHDAIDQLYNMEATLTTFSTTDSNISLACYHINQAIEEWRNTGRQWECSELGYDPYAVDEALLDDGI